MGSIYAPPFVITLSVILFLGATVGFGSKDMLDDISRLTKIDKLIFGITLLACILGMCTFSYGAYSLGLVKPLN